ncbi:MAG TPA: hypothetical protein V6C76_01145 [Drouetiella sp.]
MPNPATYKLTVTTTNPSSHTLNEVVGNPRVTSPIDLQAAVGNIKLEVEGDCPRLVEAVVRYVFTEFFALAHRTGLYNRQKHLWESIARVNDIVVNRVKEGFLMKTDFPYLDVVFQDAKGRPVILACVAEPDAMHGSEKDVDKNLEWALKSLKQRAEKMKSKGGTLAGVFCVYPEPFPEIVLRQVEKLVGAEDPVGKFESIMPEPLLIPIDLLEVDMVKLAKDDHSNSVRLIHPDLAVKGRAKAD